MLFEVLFFPKSVCEILVFDGCSFIHFFIHLLLKYLLLIYICNVAGTMPSQKGPLVLWEVTSPEPIWHCCSCDHKDASRMLPFLRILNLQDAELLTFIEGACP